MKYRSSFTIPLNNQKNKHPIGYRRTTQNSKWDKKSKEYEVWKDFVAECFHRQCSELRVKERQKSRLEIMIYYPNNKKSDPSNVFKGIEDALADKFTTVGKRKICIDQRLYKNDNYNVGSFDFDYDKINPRVEVEIFY